MKRIFIVASLLLAAIFVKPTALSATEPDSFLSDESAAESTSPAENNQSKLGQYFQPDMVLKGKYELDTQQGKSRFSVRNTRLGLKGKIAPFMSYRIQVELSDNGSFKILDLFAKFTPVKGLDITAGQASVPIFNGYTVSPGSLLFSNRPFIGKYFTSSRDIGINIAYKIKQQGFPIAIEAGVYNGDGINNPDWNYAPAIGGRILFGGMKGFRATAKAMKMEKGEEKDYFFWGADVRYKSDRFLFEAEVMERHNHFSKDALFSSYVQSAYTIPCGNKYLTGIEPALRWDALGYDVMDKGFGVNRATAGVNFNLDVKPFRAIFRVNYEHYMNRAGVVIPDFSSADETDNNKLSLEFMLLF